MWNVSAALSLSDEALQAAAAVCRLAANMGVCVSSYSPLGHGFVCAPDLVWFTKEEGSVFMSLNNVTVDKGVKRNLPFNSFKFLFMYVICMCTFIYIFIYLFYFDSCC